uniref:Uncharacterized protein n=1 Tax=Eutreptiella gymnastica TaxID=73025 RepID=A0A7S4FF00_9EUGL
MHPSNVWAHFASSAICRAADCRHQQTHGNGHDQERRHLRADAWVVAQGHEENGVHFKFEDWLKTREERDVLVLHQKYNQSLTEDFLPQSPGPPLPLRSACGQPDSKGPNDSRTLEPDRINLLRQAPSSLEWPPCYPRPPEDDNVDHLSLSMLEDSYAMNYSMLHNAVGCSKPLDPLWPSTSEEDGDHYFDHYFDLSHVSLVSTHNGGFTIPFAKRPAAPSPASHCLHHPSPRNHTTARSMGGHQPRRLFPTASPACSTPGRRELPSTRSSPPLRPPLASPPASHSRTATPIQSTGIPSGPSPGASPEAGGCTFLSSSSSRVSVSSVSSQESLSASGRLSSPDETPKPAIQGAVEESGTGQEALCVWQRAESATQQLVRGAETNAGLMTGHEQHQQPPQHGQQGFPQVQGQLKAKVLPQAQQHRQQQEDPEAQSGLPPQPHPQHQQPLQQLQPPPLAPLQQQQQQRQQLQQSQLRPQQTSHYHNHPHLNQDVEQAQQLQQQQLLHHHQQPIISPSLNARSSHLPSPFPRTLALSGLQPVLNAAEPVSTASREHTHTRSQVYTPQGVSKSLCSLSTSQIDAPRPVPLFPKHRTSSLSSAHGPVPLNPGSLTDTSRVSSTLSQGSLHASDLQNLRQLDNSSLSQPDRLQGVQKHDVISMSSLNNLETVPLEDLPVIDDDQLEDLFRFATRGRDQSQVHTGSSRKDWSESQLAFFQKLEAEEQAQVAASKQDPEDRRKAILKQAQAEVIISQCSICSQDCIDFNASGLQSKHTQTEGLCHAMVKNKGSRRASMTASGSPRKPARKPVWRP